MLRNGGEAGAQKARLARTFKAILTFTPVEKSQTVLRARKQRSVVPAALVDWRPAPVESKLGLPERAKSSP